MWCCPKLPYFLKIAKGKKGKSQQKNVQLSNSWQLFAAISPKIKLFLSSEETDKMSSERENKMYLEAIILFVRWTMFTHKSALLRQYLQTAMWDDFNSKQIWDCLPTPTSTGRRSWFPWLCWCWCHPSPNCYYNHCHQHHQYHHHQQHKLCYIYNHHHPCHHHQIVFSTLTKVSPACQLETMIMHHNPNTESTSGHHWYLSTMTMN